MDSNGISAHGTLIKINGVLLGEVKDITPPPLTRKPIETTTQNSDDDSYAPGIRRKGELQFMTNFLPGSDVVVQGKWDSGVKDLWEIDYPDGGSWLFSGFVSNVAPKAPVDGGLEASVSVRPSGGHIFNE